MNKWHAGGGNDVLDLSLWFLTQVTSLRQKTNSLRHMHFFLFFFVYLYTNDMHHWWLGWRFFLPRGLIVDSIRRALPFASLLKSNQCVHTLSFTSNDNEMTMVCVSVCQISREAHWYVNIWIRGSVACNRVLLNPLFRRFCAVCWHWIVELFIICIGLLHHDLLSTGFLAVSQGAFSC